MRLVEIRAYTESQTYAIVEANDEVIHSPILRWKTPTPEERSASFMVQTKKPVETGRDD